MRSIWIIGVVSFCVPLLFLFFVLFFVLLLMLHSFSGAYFLVFSRSFFYNLFCISRSWVVFSCFVGGEITMVILDWVDVGVSAFGGVVSSLSRRYLRMQFCHRLVFLLCSIQVVGSRHLASVQLFSYGFLPVLRPELSFSSLRHLFGTWGNVILRLFLECLGSLFPAVFCCPFVFLVLFSSWQRRLYGYRYR